MESPTRIQDLRRALADQQPLQALALLRSLQCQGLPTPLLRPVLSECHPGLDPPYLDLTLVPPSVLLLAQLTEVPDDCPLDPRRIELSHGCDLAAFAQQHLNRVLRGELPLYAGLPPIEIRHYRSLGQVHPLRHSLIGQHSALECLALEPEPGTHGASSPLDRWAPSSLDALLHVPLVLVDGPGQHHGALAAGVLHTDAWRQVNDLESAASLGRHAALRVLQGGGFYLLWNRHDPPPLEWGSLLRCLTQDQGVPFQQFRWTADGTETLRGSSGSPDPALLAISARWLARRQPHQILTFLRHWLAPVHRQPCAGISIPHLRGVLLLAATALQVDELGIEPLLQRARERAIEGGFDHGALLQLGGSKIGSVAEQIRRLCVDHPTERLIISLVGPDDRPVLGAWPQLLPQFVQESDAMVCTDEELIWSSRPFRTGLRQFSGCITPWRVIARGHVPGLLTVSARSVVGLGLQPAYLSLHGLARDLALLWLARFGDLYVQPQLLLHRNPVSHPAVSSIASSDQAVHWSLDQNDELVSILQRHASHWLCAQGRFAPTSQKGIFRVEYSALASDLVSVIIPYRDKAELTRTCVLSLLQQTLPLALEIILVDNGSCEPEAVALADELIIHAQEAGVSLVGVRDESPFNYAALNNRARAHCRGNYLFFLNNDINFVSSDALQRLLDPFGMASTGAVGSRLLYEDGTIQHHGLVAAARQPHDILSPAKGLVPGPSTAPFLVLDVQEQWSAATAACLLIRSDLFDRLAGFDESFAVAYNDVDLCWRMGDLGYAVIVVPEPLIIHSESKSRGEDIAGEKRNRLAFESGILRKRYPDYFLNGDPYYHRLLDQASHRFDPMLLPARPLRQAQDQLIYTWTRPHFREESGRPLLIYVHWAPVYDVRPDVIEQLKCYQSYADLVFVSAAENLAASPVQIKELQQYVDVLLIRRNEGYDFASWKAGLNFCRKSALRAPWVILVNDSCYGPLQPLSNVFSKLEACKSDVVGLTGSTSICNHLQSYFVAYRWNVVRSGIFSAFWDSIGVWLSKVDLVLAHEVSWSGVLQDIGFSIHALYLSGVHGNVTHTHWRQLLSQDYPFIKTELLRVNPILQDIDGWQIVASSLNPAVADMILKHLGLPALAQMKRWPPATLLGSLLASRQS